MFAHDARTVIVVADGAGGSGAGALAAKKVIREVESGYTQIHSAAEWSVFLRQIDCRINDGESTAVVVDIRPFGIAGASVGDSRAMIISEELVTELTIHQHRKPLLGSGQAEPVGFTSEPLDGVLLVGTDGFFNYAKPEAIRALVIADDFPTLPRRCIESVRLKSGEYWDDIGMVAARNRPRSKTRQRYVIH